MLNIRELVNKIHSSESKNICVITQTGGGFSGIYYLMSEVGASNTILDIRGPYAREATLSYISKPIESFASEEAANELAISSLTRAKELSTLNCIGIGIVASLVSSTWKRGPHRCHIVILSDTNKWTFSLNLKKGLEGEKPFRSRCEEDDLCGSLIVCALAHVYGFVSKEELYNIFDNINIKNENNLF